MDRKMNNDTYLDVQREIIQLKQKGYSWSEAYDILQDLIEEAAAKVKEKKRDYRAFLVSTIRDAIAKNLLEKGFVIEDVEEEWSFIGSFTLKQFMDLKK